MTYTKKPHLIYAFFGLIFSTLLSISASAAKPKADAIIGKWKVFSHINGKLVATIEMKKNPKNNTYYARIVSQTKTHTDYTKICNNCPKPFTKKPVIGMTMLWNLKAKNPNKAEYTGGYGIDPWKGKMFQGSAKVTGKNGKLLKLRGSPIETRWVGQTFTFIRAK